MKLRATSRTCHTKSRSDTAPFEPVDETSKATRWSKYHLLVHRFNLSDDSPVTAVVDQCTHSKVCGVLGVELGAPSRRKRSTPSLVSRFSPGPRRRERTLLARLGKDRGEEAWRRLAKDCSRDTSPKTSMRRCAERRRRSSCESSVSIHATLCTAAAVATSVTLLFTGYRRALFQRAGSSPCGCDGRKSWGHMLVFASKSEERKCNVHSSVYFWSGWGLSSVNARHIYVHTYMQLF